MSTDLNLDGIVDDLVTYDYDANDRLVEELLDSTDNAKDRTTTYSYDQTQQTEKLVTRSVSEGQQSVSRQHFAYNLQGRMSSVINDGFDSSGNLNSRERTSYTYDSRSFRINLTNETTSDFGSDPTDVTSWTLASSISFLAAHNNHTGYAQTIRETTTNADGTTKTTDYTFGHDEISQRVVERDAAGTITSDTTHIFGHDGHGSVRMLTDLSGVIAQVFTFAAYGSMVAVHSGNGSLAGTTEAAALTSLGYSGEHFDGKAQQQYLRARFYNPANGRFNRLDPFAGNSADPQSFHKYLYTHADPVNGIDPTGHFTAISISVAGTVRNQVSAAYGGAALGIGASLPALEEGISTHQTLFNFLLDYALEPLDEAVNTIAAFLDFSQWLVSEGVGIFRKATEFVFGNNGTASSNTQNANLGSGTAILIGDRLIHWYNSRRTLLSNKLYKVAFNPNTQSNHLNQWGAFRDEWARSGRSRGQALALTLDGNASTHGTEHNRFHSAIDEFFDDYRSGGRREGDPWSVNDYNRAASEGMRRAGLSRDERARALLAMRSEQHDIRLSGTSRLTRVPRRVTRRR